MKSTRALIAIAILSLSFTSCLGPNPTMNTFRNWNANLTDNKWANEGIFVLTSPAHALAWFSDVVVFNSWHFWTGEYLWCDDPGAYPISLLK